MPTKQGDCVVMNASTAPHRSCLRKDHTATLINAVNLENMLDKIKPDHDKAHMDGPRMWLLRRRNPMAPECRWLRPSKPSNLWRAGIIPSAR